MAADMALPPSPHIRPSTSLQPGPVSISAGMSAELGTRPADLTPIAPPPATAPRPKLLSPAASPADCRPATTTSLAVVVLGAEGTFSGSSLRGATLRLTGVNTLTTSVDYFGTVTGKVRLRGWLAAALRKRRRGLDAHQSTATFNAAESLTFTANYWQTGWTVGGGGEYAFSPNWSVESRVRIHRHPRTSLRLSLFAGRVFSRRSCTSKSIRSPPASITASSAPKSGHCLSSAESSARGRLPAAC